MHCGLISHFPTQDNIHKLQSSIQLLVLSKQTERVLKKNHLDFFQTQKDGEGEKGGVYLF